MRLNADEKRVLREVLLKHLPDLADTMTVAEFAALPSSELERVREALEWEFCEAGIGPDDEPNQYGLIVDSIIGWLPLRS